MTIDSLSSSYLNECRNALKEEQTRSLAATNHWEDVDRPLVHADWDALYKQIGPLVESADPTSKQIQTLIAAHYDIACRFYVPTARAYVGMALNYREDADMASFHNAYHPNMVPFLADAMCSYAHNNLS
ncbi:TipAS antibiotic-recognition domain-containing protein [Arthrobacter rhizosphaerae]|uniref:TipAS antibiotic-recognition domain-containing protein n=1 Tax=Arthrobacter rhizosphaerae TaxID=2855490 RepID=UPI001FF4C783|nr:TipAS antibiotic-recognition domain-containing protein [Arthrobacter rhizosphaerae]